jgi:radical SAM protein with 4Fe4S-binding SPASM domain
MERNDQMKYILSPDIALRSWIRVPFAFYRYGINAPGKLTAEEFEYLLLCDGKTENEESALSNALMKRGLIREAGPGASLSDWQKARICDNRCFPSISIMITGKCNYNCRHCFNAADNAALMTELSREDLLSLLDQIEACGIQSVSLTGGEPMMHPYFMDVVRECAKRRLVIDILNTNGSFLTEEILNEMRSLCEVPLLKISFDGIGHHDWMRNAKGAEERTRKAIEASVRNGFPVMAQTNIHRGNLDALLETADYLEEAGVMTMRIIRTTESPRWVRNGGASCLTLKEYYDEVLKFAEAYMSKPRRMQIEAWQFLFLEPYRKTYSLITVPNCDLKYRDTIPVCRGNRNMVAITSSGEAAPCQQMSGKLMQDQISYGNIKKQSLQSILKEGPYLDAVTETIGSVRDHNAACQVCPWWKKCCGGCRAIAYAIGNDLLGVDPAKCEFFKNGYYKKTRELMRKNNWTCPDEEE